MSAQEFARRAYCAVANPQYNPMKEVMDMCESVEKMPPMLGIFNDIPGHKLREDEVNSWAKAGFTWVVNDGEHQIYEGRYGFEQNMMELRNGLLPVQRLHREAVSEHGDAFQKGARATMRPYGTTVEEAAQYYKAVTFPTEGSATKDDRGGYPTRDGARKMAFTPKELRDAEAPWTQGWIQFETGEYILSDEKYNQGIRDAVLDIMQKQGRNKACGFIGPFDAVIRDGVNPKMNDGINTLIKEAAKRGIAMGRVVGNGAMEDPKDIEDAMVEAIQNGARLICVHRMTSDLPFVSCCLFLHTTHNATRCAARCTHIGTCCPSCLSGRFLLPIAPGVPFSDPPSVCGCLPLCQYGAEVVAAPFWKACKRCGF